MVEPRIVVLGAGPAGAATAIGLRRLGHTVTVVSEWRRFAAVEGVSQRVLEGLRHAGLSGALSEAAMPATRQVRWNGEQSQISKAKKIAEPKGPVVNDFGDVEVIVVPALRIDRSGYRLGQGGGYYDRVLSLVRPDVPIIAMIYDHELLPAGAIPHEAHDVRVTHVCTPNDGLRAVKPASATP